MKNDKYSRSRQNTEWTDLDKGEITSLQFFIDAINHRNFDLKHIELSNEYEKALLNSYKPSVCPYCHMGKMKKFGFTKNEVQRYKCTSSNCKRIFTITTNTLFNNHKISITEWVDFCLDLFGYKSFNSISKTQRNSFTTTKYWISKIFILLQHFQDDIVFNGSVYIDEAYYKLPKSDIDKLGDMKHKKRSDTHQLIGIACCENKVFCKIEDTKIDAQKRTVLTFKNHIANGSKLIHDSATSHSELVKILNLKSDAHLAIESKGVDDKDDPLHLVNSYCNRLKSFFSSHSGFSRDNMQDYLNLFCFIQNTPKDPQKKVEKLLEMALKTPMNHTYRQEYSKDLKF
jgi:transposase-like protein